MIAHPEYIALAGSIACTCAGQILMKGAQRQPSRYPLNNLLHPLMILGLASMFMVTILSTYVLGKIELRTYTAWSSLNYPFTVLLAGAIYKEAVGRNILTGVTLVSLGVLIFSL